MLPSMTKIKEYEEWKKNELKERLEYLPQELIGKQWLPETDFTQYKKYYDKILGFSLESKNNGDILWGRVQGTEAEKKTLLFVKESLEKAGLDEVILEEFPCFEKQWKPTRCELTIKTGTQSIKIESVVTAFQSGQTPEAGIDAEIIYVGEGSPSELAGRDLKGKIVLLSAHCYPNALLNSARKAFSRLPETGALGAIIWWQLPANLPVAGRVGTPMGGDHKGAALPWISIARNEGTMIRRLLDEGEPIFAHMTVTGLMEERQSGHVMGWLKGKTDKIIMLTMHVDGYFYAMHDNGAGVAIGLELARLLAQKTLKEREYTILFHFSGDHEVPGAGGSRILAKNTELMKRVIVAYQIEHVFSKIYIDDSGLASTSNVQSPLAVFVSGKQKNLINLFHETAKVHGIPVLDITLAEPHGDIQGFYPPFAKDSSLLCAGFIEATAFYHSTADIDLGILSDEGIARALRAYQYILDRSLQEPLPFFDYDCSLFPKEHLFSSPYFACLYQEF